MRIAFAGTPAFAAVALGAILDAGHTIPLVLTQPDRPAGRGLKPHASAVSELAAVRGLPVLSPRSLREASGDQSARQAVQALRSAAPDLMVVAAYGLILPQTVLDIPSGIPGCSGVARAVNIHASLLPRWRGAAPVARAIEAGDSRTGITLMQMDAGLDTGPMLRSEAIPIEGTDTTGTLTARLAQLGARLIVSWFDEAVHGQWEATAQPSEGVSTARKIGKSEAWLDWREPAAVLARRVRAFDPQPGACGRLGDGLLKIWSAQALAQTRAAEPGTVLSAAADGIAVACGEGVLVICELQRSGGRRLRAREYLAGAPIAAGARWQAASEGRESH
jgi:methionyl-tRNA formyltransferase